MNREKKLVKNTLIITIGKICTQLITFLLLPLYTGVLSTEEFGIVDLLNTLVSLLLPIVTFQIEQGMFRELIEVRSNEEEKKKIITSGFIAIFVQCILFSIIYLVVANFINNEYKYYLLFNVIAYIFSSLMLQISRGVGDNKKYAVGSFISATTTIFFNVFFLVIIKLRANGMLLGTFLGQLSCYIYLFIFLKIYNYINFKKFKKEVLAKLLKYSVPLIPNAISWWVFNASDRLIVSSLMGVSMNGILATANKFSSVIVTIYNIFHISWTESVALHIDDEDIENYFNKIMNVIFILFICIVFGAISVMPFAFPILINSNYNSAYNYIPILMLASLFNVLQGLVAVIYSAKKNTKSIANTSIVAAIINIIIHLALIKVIGLYAAIISTIASFMIISIYRCIDINNKYMKIKFDKKNIVISLFIGIIVCILYYINNKYLNLLSILITIVFSIHVNKNNIEIIVSFIKKKKGKRKV